MLRTNEELDRPPPEDLANLLFGTYRHRVLSLLFLRPGDSFHVRMIARLTGVPAGSLHRELRLLYEAGLLLGSRIGNQVHYAANRELSVFRELASMLEKTAGAPPMLEEPSEEHSLAMPALEVPTLAPERKARSRKARRRTRRARR